MEYINQMKELELNVASDYLVMASELVKIKSHMLLPEPPMANEDYEDPREQLMSQLIEYQNYKLYAEELNKLKEENRLQFVKAPHNHEDDEDDTNTLELSLHDLLEAYNKVKSRVSITEESYVVVQREVYTKEEAVTFIASKFKDRKSLKMTELLTFNEPRSKVVQVFITILDYISQNLYQITRIDEDDFELERLA